ncbi:MAG: hypothetical protein JSV44_00245 [Candidatus Zixiibacteriota bacterium]|nr:MAG: hypothetical protein JSV44_00245 [candidate division Zixibacteria bacterium]
MVENFAENWLAHDGLWFRAIKKECGLNTAIKLDTEAWDTFTRIEASRIMARHNIASNGELAALKKAPAFRLFSVLNRQEICDKTGKSSVFKMLGCRVKSALERRNLPLFHVSWPGLSNIGSLPE